ncbi:hypothetical protein B879_04243 [Cecembia lonarensis LW9]|uniref:Uncharacterized protein n=1 Tax=Cecembia lonarensis (strain CCUG 58316 / KCTC 22772 / LW9) TaxID=1225176 RepID=K1LST4_CECL9|nr:hypothetical protein B879_04243 [Cecembia lonarensis LW9]
MDDIRFSAAMAPATINGTLENAVVCSNEYRNSWVGGGARGDMRRKHEMR